jgi:hypothetical protein
VGNILQARQHDSSASLSVLKEPQKYFDEHEHIDDVQMQVLKGMKEKMTAKY